MDIILQIILAIFAAIIIYTLIGFIPGTDETSVLLPITLVLVLTGIDPRVILSFFVASITTLSVTNAIPTALVGLPGGVMATPMMEHSLYLKDKGLSAVVIKKMATGSLIGVVVALPVTLILANLIAPYGEFLKQYASILFVFGAIFLSLLSKAKILSLLSIIPLSMLFMALRHLYWGIGLVPQNKTVTVSFFLGITIGPLIISLVELLNKEKREKLKTDSYKEIVIPKGETKQLNPFKIVDKYEMVKAGISAFIANFLFVLSPVGLTILFGEMMGKNKKSKTHEAYTTITVMSSMIQATYISGLLIPLIALGIPLSPVSIGPGIALFNAEPVFTLNKNIHHVLPFSQMLLPILLGVGIALTVSYVLANKYASVISTFVLKKIPHEAILGLFIAFIVLLSYMDAGIVNIFGVLLIGVVSGYLNRQGVNYGVQFMALYAAPWLIANIVG
ncbi:tripartite tricarboxylate transporter permease [Helcococcus bovis]|uniref:tripartite tricarboxylate transporter permease n=1 Tax=Helcococcus bovis TaxID=3153252 RepID=UPI0038B9A641